MFSEEPASTEGESTAGVFFASLWHYPIMHGTFRSFPLLLSSAAVRMHPKEEMVAMPNGIHTLGWQWLQHTEIKE